MRVIDPAFSRALLWREVNLWSQTEETISEEVKTHIKRMHRSFEIAKAPILKKWGMIVKYMVTDYRSIRSGLYNINFRHSLLS